MQRESEEQQGAERETTVAGQQDALAGDEIRGMAGKKEKKDAGCELREPDQAEIERAMRQIEDLPAHGDGLHLRGCDREKASRGRVAEIGIAEGGAGVRQVY